MFEFTIVVIWSFKLGVQLERIQRFVGEEAVKVEVIEELEREYDTTQRQLKELEISNEARRRREIQTLRRFGVMDSAISGIRYSLPDIEISRIRNQSSIGNQSEEAASEEEEVLDEADEEDIYRKKKTWRALGWLSASPIFFRPRSRSETTSRKYRAMSAGVVPNQSSTTVLSLRRLYTGRSEFYDVEDEVVEPTNRIATLEQARDVPAVRPSMLINQRTLDEINRFENLIKNYFLKKQHKRYWNPDFHQLASQIRWIDNVR